MAKTDILLITPPFTQPNTPYPATVFLKGFLTRNGFSVRQSDLGIETTAEIFSFGGLTSIFDMAESSKKLLRHHVKMLKSREKYCELIEPVMQFLQGNNKSFACLVLDGILPRGKRYEMSAGNECLFNDGDEETRAKYLATLFIEDIGDLITAHIDTNFGFTRYAEHLGVSAPSFAPVESKIACGTPLTDIMCRLLGKAIKQYSPRIAAFTIPFPGNLLSALKLSLYIKRNFPGIPVIAGGGWVNTELRRLSDPGFFNYVDYLCLDSGERPLLQLLRYLLYKGPRSALVRTFVRENGVICYCNNEDLADIAPADTGTPDYSDLPLNKYISVVEMANPMHCLWTNGRWNKLMIARGCYWHKCAFCDTSLDYIRKYKPVPFRVLADRIESVIGQTGYNGFHFVDEAAPPAALKKLAEEIIRRGIKILWWTNIRFEPGFDKELCALLAKSGCIAVSGGLEALSDRLLLKMNKGITIKQAAVVTDHFKKAGIMVHAYLMYGFPTQTAQETVNALEVIRQFFKNKLIQSAYWHRFSMTVHSPIGKSPGQFNVKAVRRGFVPFANNGLPHSDPSGCDHARFSYGLRKALYNYMHGSCLDYPVREWFDFKVPPVTLPSDLIGEALRAE